MSLTITPNGVFVIENGTDANGGPENGRADAADGGAVLKSDAELMPTIIRALYDEVHRIAEPVLGLSHHEWLAARRMLTRMRQIVNDAGL